MKILPQGIVSVLQTPFDAELRLDLAGTLNLVDDALASDVDGFIIPAVASEVAFLTRDERRQLVETVAARVRGRVPVILGASGETPAACGEHVRLAADLGLAASLVAIPTALYSRPLAIIDFFVEVARCAPGPLVIQDLQFEGPGLGLAHIAELRRRLPSLIGMKIETVPAGPKYTAVRAAGGDDFWIAGGWAVPQMIEALDRAVDALVPESAMIRIYKAVDRAHRRGNRPKAVSLFRELLPVLAFANQEIGTSVAFFKRLLVRKGVFASPAQRMPLPGWDAVSERIASELIEHYLALETREGRQAQD